MRLHQSCVCHLCDECLPIRERRPPKSTLRDIGVAGIGEQGNVLFCYGSFLPHVFPRGGPVKFTAPYSTPSVFPTRQCAREGRCLAP